MGSGFTRALSPVERLYAAGQELAPPLAIQLCVEGDGDLTRAALQAAVDRAAAACPGASLRRGGGRWVATGGAPVVRELPPLAGPGVEALWAHPLVRRPLRDAGAEVLFWPGQPARILFRAAHAAMDGHGCLLWARQVFACLRGEVPTPLRDPTTDQDLVRAAGRGAAAAPALDARAPFAAQAPYLAFPLVRRLRLPPGQPALVARLGALLAAEAPGEPLRLMVPIDLRRHRPGLASCANLALPVFLDAAAGEEWGALQGRLLAAMQAGAELGAAAPPALGLLPDAALGGLIAAAGLACHVRGRYLASALLSHLGRVPLAALSGPGFRARTACSLPVHTPFVPLTAVMIETDGGTELAVAASLTPAQAAPLDAWLARVAAALGTAPASAAPASTEAPSVGGADVDGAFAGPLPAGGAAAARASAGPSPAASPDVGPAPATPTPAPERVIDGAPSLVAGGFEGVWGAIARQAAAVPAAPAVVFRGATTSYRDLVAQADARAAGAWRQGVRPGDRVAVLVERDAASLGLLLACLRLGVAFVPIDAAQPDARIARLVAQSGARCCLVGDPALRARLAPGLACAVLAPDDLQAPGEPPPPPPAELPDADVYVIHTSGSTSAPKAVPITQRNLASYLLWARDAYGVGPATRFALISSLAFDLAITAWLLPLVAGGSVAILDGPAWPDPLARFLADAGATALKLAPAHLALLAGLPPAALPAVGLVVVGGAQLLAADAAAALGRFGPGCALFNEYGPTEATVGCVVHRHADGVASGPVPIGRPIAGSRLILRDAPGEEGACELLLRGDGVARGYLAGDAAGAFERQPDGGVAYRTGDLVRVLADGQLAFVGRRGDAFKVHGHRVDRHELVDALRALPGVADAHVLAEPDGRLTAYLAGTDPGDPRAALLAQLPAYMVPSAFRLVAALPLTANGKVDEAALRRIPAPALAEPAPLPPGQARVAAAWQQVLGLAEPPGAAAGFFALGGDSLGLLALAARLGAPVADLLADPTVAGMAAALARRG